MFYFWLGLALTFTLPLFILFALASLHVYLRVCYLHYMVRGFQVKPLFVVPRGQPAPAAEEARFPTADGLTLSGCYLHAAGPRRGVILFGVEFGSNRWSCLSYCEHLREAGFDVFAFEPRCQGDSETQPGYEPLQWVTDFELRDMRAALAYLKARPDADPRGVGLFGISRGGCAGLMAAATDPYVRCCAVDGIYATYTTLVPYLRKWFGIYNSRYALQGLLPDWYYGHLGLVGMRRVERQRRCRFLHLESFMSRLGPRPLLMIHGGGDTYIKPRMARLLFDRAREPKEFWLVKGAKHNQGLQIAGDEYRKRVLEFFQKNLAEPSRSDTRPALAEAV